jgi:micrococcal nuclease
MQKSPSLKALLLLALLTNNASAHQRAYSAIVTSVYDGDTITVKINMGMNIYRENVKIRLFGINAPEVRGAERLQGLLSRDFLREKILDKRVTIKTQKKDKKGKYGRLLGTIWHKGFDINKVLVEEGFAKYKEY